MRCIKYQLAYRPQAHIFHFMLYSLKSSGDSAYSILFKYKSTKNVVIGFRMSHYVEAGLPSAGPPKQNPLIQIIQA